MLTRTHITTLLVLAVVVWGTTLLLLGLPVTWQYIAPFTLTVTVLTGACLVFDRWCWRWSLFRGWFVKQPDIQGTWKARLVSNWIDPETSQQIPPIDCIMVVRQTFSSLSARLFTGESSSFLIAHNLVCQNDGVFQLLGVYQNTPQIGLRGQRSDMHYGALLLEVRGDPPAALVGHYWTDRGTKGAIELTDRTPDLLSGYEEGARKFRLTA
jgi:predicted pore-forming effector associated with SMODS systems